MKVALFGGTGFVGSYIIDELIASGQTPRVLVRPGSEEKLMQEEKCELVYGEISDIGAINNTLLGAEAAIYNIGVIRQYPRKGITYEDLHFDGARSCMDQCENVGIDRFILMSANGVKPDGTGYQKTKWLAEQYLINTGLKWTIFRPSLIFGDPRGSNRPEFCTQLKKDLIRLPIPAPLFHKGLLPVDAGKFSMSPIHVKDVASIFVGSLASEDTISKIFELGGPNTLDWKEIIKTIAKGSGKNKWTIPAPAIFISSLAVLVDRFSWFPITRDQLTMLMEGNTCEPSELFTKLEVGPKTFTPEELSYLK